MPQGNCSVPGALEDPAIILRRLKFQNPALKTSYWRVYQGNTGNEERSAGAGWILILGIPEGATRTLKALDFRPYLGSGKVSFSLSQRVPSEGTATTGNTLWSILVDALRGRLCDPVTGCLPRHVDGPHKVSSPYRWALVELIRAISEPKEDGTESLHEEI